MACAHTFEYLEEKGGGQEPDFAEIRRRFYQEARLHYRYIWDTFDPHEKSAVLRVAKGQGIPDALKHVLQELGTRHYVETADKRPQLFASTFEEFVKTEGGRAGKPSMLGRWLGRG